jgi:hypothetical protein
VAKVATRFIAVVVISSLLTPQKLRQTLKIRRLAANSQKSLRLMLVGAAHKTKESREILLSMQRNPHWQGCIPEWGPDKGEPDF